MENSYLYIPENNTRPSRRTLWTTGTIFGVAAVGFAAYASLGDRDDARPAAKGEGRRLGLLLV